MLKLTKLFFMLTLLTFMTACSNDDEESTPDASSLVGTWSAVSFTADITSVVAIPVTGDITSTTNAVGSNFDYTVTFTDAAFTTAGGYDVMTSGVAAGVNIPETTSTYSDVDGSGTYTSTDTELTISGSFYSFDVDGMDLDALGETQTVEYEINSDDELIITQNETMETTAGGFTTTTTIVSSSKWTRQ